MYRLQNYQQCWTKCGPDRHQTLWGNILRSRERNNCDFRRCFLKMAKVWCGMEVWSAGRWPGGDASSRGLEIYPLT